MNYKLYTLGQKGDNFYLDYKKALNEQKRREAIGDKECVLQTLKYYPILAGKSSVIEVSYKFNKYRFRHGYVIENGFCYGCDLTEETNIEWLDCSNQLSMVYNWYLGFEQMYPELCNEDTNIILDELEKIANDWIKFILGYENIKHLEVGIKKFGLNQKTATIVRLGYAEICYLNGKIKEGDKYLQRVDLTLSNTHNEGLDIYFKEVLNLRNKKVKNDKGIVLIRFKSS